MPCKDLVSELLMQFHKVDEPSLALAYLTGLPALSSAGRTFYPSASAATRAGLHTSLHSPFPVAGGAGLTLTDRARPVNPFPARLRGPVRFIPVYHDISVSVTGTAVHYIVNLA